MEYLHNREVEDKLFLRWVVGFQTEMSFEDFKLELTPSAKKTDEQIIEEVRQLFATKE